MNLNEIHQALSERGCRRTALRTAILEILFERAEPLSVLDLQDQLSHRSHFPNKTTVYRQLETLIEHDVVDAVLVDPKSQHYELKKHHHHHFVCESCSEVLDVDSEEIESAFHRFESQLSKRGFSIQKHELTFFGECAACH